MLTAPISSRALTRAYVFALLIIASLSIASHIALEASLQSNEGSAAVINRSGRQRMFSQRIASLAGQWKAGDATARAELRAATGEFETAHEFLLLALQGEAVREDGGRELQAIYFGPNSLDTQVRSFIADARQVAALEPNDPRIALPLSRIVVEARQPLLTALNNVVGIEQARSETRLNRLEQLQWAILITVLVTLMIEASFIFRPMIKKIADYTHELVRIATTDSLTGLANRRSFLEQCEVECARARRYGRPAGILMIDLDHFKSINDTYGHAAGDAVLAETGRVLHDSFGQIGIVGRLGGEEFGVLLLETALPEAVHVAERLRQFFATMKVRWQDQTIRLTASIGCTCIDKDITRLDDGLRRADQLMYLAKQNGRNRVVANTAMLALT